ncbi:LPS-assembly protein LptD [candidate division KSB1 bacterium]|nr:LPS-assembly protein LptD [candidate division KSB1 bacterium]
MKFVFSTKVILIAISISIFLLLTIFNIYQPLYAWQDQQSKQNSNPSITASSDSVAVDSLLAQPDSLTTPKKSSSGLDAKLNYNAHIVNPKPQENLVYLIGKAEVKYKKIHLQAGKITVDWDTNILIAEGIPDTVYKPAENGIDSVMEIINKELPVLSDAGDVIQGEKMIFNFKTEKGRVIKGRTEFEGGYYFGESMKRISSEVINFSNAYFTSCDKKEDPHFHFRSRRIKVIVGERVIAKPVVLYFGKVPMAILPFAVFPTKRGRQSGILIPTYGESSSEGRFIRGLGYYWAASDYFDASAKIDFFDRSGVIFRGDVNYALRYLLNGRISGSFTKKNFITGTKQQRWDLLISHRHTINPTSNFQVSGSFVSDNSFYKDYSSNFNTRLNRKIRSNATYSKSWPEKRLTFSANISQERDVESGSITQTLPQLRFSMSQRSVFGKSKSRTGSSSFSGSSRSKKDTRWYEAIYFSYSSNLYNRTTRGGDSPERMTRYLNHNASLSMNTPKKLFGWLTTGQSFRYEERWYDRYKKNEFNYETNDVEIDTVQGFAARRTFSHSLNASTNIYGMFTPKIGNIVAIRHVVSPGLSFSYQPDFSKSKWGYVDTFADSTGEEKNYQRFMDGVSTSGQKRLSFSVRNLFQMKTSDGEKEKKHELFSLNFSSGYNFEADSLRFSNLSTSFRSTIGRNLNINISANHSFYKYDLGAKRTVNQFLLNDWDSIKGLKFLRLNNLRFSASIRLQGKKKSDGKSKADETEQKQFFDEVTGEPVSEQEYYDRMYEPGGNRFEVDNRFSGLDISWRTSLALSFSLNNYNPANPTKNYYLDINGMEVKLTKNWKINYSAHYDLEKKQIVNHSFTFYRDIHCWEARLTWRPSGIGGNSFYLRINVKAPQLRDLKYEKRGGRSSVLRY